MAPIFDNGTSLLYNIPSHRIKPMSPGIPSKPFKDTHEEQISAEDAKKLMDTESDFIIIDARTTEEFAEGHIPDAVLIPEYEIADRAPSELPDKDRLILVYCRSGRRSKIASAALVELGYTNVKEFGGILDWPYDVVTD